MGKFVLYMLVGIVLALLGILAIYIERRKMSRCTAKTTATIVSVEKEKKVEGESVYIPVYEYSAGNKIMQEKGYIHSSGKDKYKVGQITEIAYNPDKPDEFIINGKGTGFGYALLVLALIVIAVSFSQL